MVCASELWPMIIIGNIDKIVNVGCHRNFLPWMDKVPLSWLEDNDIALREDNAPIYGEILPVKPLPLKSKISKLLKFTISTKRIDQRWCQENVYKMAHWEY